MSNRALPDQTFRLVNNHVQGCRHVGLILDRFAPWQDTGKGKAIPYWDLKRTTREKRKGQLVDVDQLGGAAKGIWLRETFQQDHADPELIQAQRARWREAIEALGGVIIKAKLKSRLLVGLGATHVLETALTLDRTSGTPVVPGSAAKGLARTYALFEVAKELGIRASSSQGDEETALRELDEHLSDAKADARTELGAQFRAVFGTTAAAGAVIFMGGVYAGDEAPRLVSDVMTPHFGDYYQGSSPPADNLDPNPIHFVAVEAGQSFWFGLAPRRPQDSDWLNPAQKWLKGGLTRLGAGGKTAAGYGYFRLLESA